MMRLTVGLLLLAGVNSSAAEPPSEETVRGAVAKALPVLWKGIDGHTVKRDCFTCHNHAVPLLAITTAKARGFDVPERKLAEQVEFITDHYEGMRERLEKGNGPGPSPIGGGADTTGYALFTFDLLGVTPNKTTEIVAEYTLGYEEKKDHWPTRGSRPPSEASGFTTTALAVRGVQKYAADGKKDQMAKRVEAARGWLLKTKPKDTEDRVFRLFGLKEAGVEEKEISAAAWELLKTQRADGGWGQLDKMASDAYATGTALVALHEAGGLRADHPAYSRGVAFLLKTQEPDGSWWVKSRSNPFQPYYEGGFPHFKNQFISSSASGWAATALVYASGQ
jgi:hypothetical protein